MHHENLKLKTITLVSYWDCSWIWLEQNGVNFLDVTSQNQMLKCPL